MIKQILLCGAASLGLASFALPAWSQDRAASTPKAGAASAASRKPQLGTWGFDTAGMDRSVKPGDNFFDFANGHWARNTQIPADRSSWGGFGVLVDLSDQRTRTIIQDAASSNGAPGSNARKVGDFYASFMDEAAVEAKGTAPLKPLLDRVAAIGNAQDLARAFGALGQYGVQAPVGGQVEQDLKNNSRYAVYVGQGGLGLPDRDYYLDDSNPKFVEARAKYRQHIATMLRLAGVADPEGKAQR
ncbi:MAG: M13 family peptidase, partial [Allosphingosinicella sp.]